MYYKSNVTGKILTEGQIQHHCDVYGDDTIAADIEMGILTKVESPSVIDFIKCGNMAGATLRYRELHNCKTKAAYDAVFAMKRDMRRISKKSNKEEG